MTAMRLERVVYWMWVCAAMNLVEQLSTGCVWWSGKRLEGSVRVKMEFDSVCADTQVLAAPETRCFTHVIADCAGFG
jgi:hypothetical protein